MSDDAFPDALDEFPRLLASVVDVRGGASSIVDFARRHLDADWAALVRYDLDGPVLLGRTSPGVDRLYLDPWPGPPAATDPVVTVADTLDAPDHPVLGPRLVRHGIRSYCAVDLPPMRSRTVRLELFAARPGVFGWRPEHVTAVLTSIGAVLQARDQAENLAAALASRTVIAQAQGMLMERYHLDAEQAMSTLRRYSQESQVKVRDVAAALVTDRAPWVPR